MAEATSERGGRNGEARLRATNPPEEHPRRPSEADRDVENYRDEYDFKTQDRRSRVVAHRT